jgi:AAA family ATP:ADP antiporter
MTNDLQRLANVRPREIVPVLVAGFMFFCVLTALMVIRPARDALGMRGGLDAVRWLFVGTAVVTLAVNPIFGFLVSRLRRLHFISATYLFFGASLLGFWWLLTFAPQSTGETSGRVFYVWFSVFNLFATMVFWALMADRFSYAQSKRLFGAIAVGGTLGAIAGPALAAVLARPIGTANLLLVSVGFLFLAIGAAWAVAMVQPERSAGPDDPEAPPIVDERTLIGGNAWEGLHAVFTSRYLLGISAFVLILAVLVTFLYFTRLSMVAALGEDTDMRATVLARIDLITQVATLLLQLIVTGHLMKRLGVAVTLALLPITVILGFVGLALAGTLAALVVFEAIFKAVQRAVMRPARETLFTVVSRADKYKAKAVTDTFVYRTGDVLGAWTEGLLGWLGMGLVGLASVAVPLAVAWGALGVWLGRTQVRMAGRNGPG